MPKKPAMTEDEYMNRRSWLIDTAETPEDKKNLPKDLAELKKQYLGGSPAQPSQPNHYVTNADNYTKTVKSEPAKDKPKFASESASVTPPAKKPTTIEKPSGALNKSAGTSSKRENLPAKANTDKYKLNK